MKKPILAVSLMILCLCVALPVLTSEKADSGKMAALLKAELKAMDEREPQKNCPLSGNPVAEGQGYNFHGNFIATCCGNCAKAVEKDPLSAILKLRKAGEEPQLAAGYSKLTECPMSGKPIDAKQTKIKDNVLLSFCCGGCPAGYAKDPEGTLKKLAAKKVAATIITIEQTECPISKHAANETSTVAFKGKLVKLCCDDCKAAFESSPDKFVQQMADSGIVLAAVK